MAAVVDETVAMIRLRGPRTHGEKAFIALWANITQEKRAAVSAGQAPEMRRLLLELLHCREPL